MMKNTQTDLNRSKILVVDDIPANLNMLIDTLEPQGYDLLAAPSGEVALQIAERRLPDLILLDIMMPKGIDGFETCRRLKQNRTTADIPVIFVTAKGDTKSMVEGFEIGGVDYIAKPFEQAEVLARIKTHLKINHLTKALLQKNHQLQTEIERRQAAEKAQKEAVDAFHHADEKLSMLSDQEAKRWGISGFIGKSRTLTKVMDSVRRLHDVKTSVLVLGENGTGKELIARAIHFGGVRAKGPFIPVNCSAIPKELAESTLFGHVKGAFTGANLTRKGQFELADTGTLFLDELGDMPLELQAKLLRTLEDGYVTPIGGNQQRQVDVRVIAATNADLQAKIAEGAFREDLYFRLARFTVHVPPLRERPEDIPLLIDHFLRLFADEMRIENPSISPEAVARLNAYHFPGNIRELKNIIEHALILSNRSAIQPEHLHLIDTSLRQIAKPSPATNEPTQPDRRQIEEIVIKRAQTNNVVKGQTPSLETDEAQILAYVRQNGTITNTECRKLLDVDRHRANYLLKKLDQYGLLVQEGSLRWTYYRLS